MELNVNVEKLITSLLNYKEPKKIAIEVAEQLFLHYVKEYKSEATLEYYKSRFKVLNAFFDLNNVTNTSQVDTGLVLKLINYLRPTNKNNSINKFIGTIKYMLNYLYKNDLIDEQRIKVGKLTNDETRFDVVDKEILQLALKQVAHYGIKSELILKLLITTGIRRTELTYIERANINLMNKSILLTHTKNHKPRNIFLTDDVAIQLKEYLNNVEASIYLFVKEDGTDRITGSSIDKIFYKLKRDLNVKHLSPHMLRHTFATSLLDNGADFETIRLLLGHSDYSMIMRYVHLSNNKLAKASTSFNPLAN